MSLRYPRALHSNPYEGPEPCQCFHDYGQHWAEDATMACSVRRCTCERFEPWDGKEMPPWDE